MRLFHYFSFYISFFHLIFWIHDQISILINPIILCIWISLLWIDNITFGKINQQLRWQFIMFLRNKLVLSIVVQFDNFVLNSVLQNNCLFEFRYTIEPLFENTEINHNQTTILFILFTKPILIQTTRSFAVILLFTKMKLIFLQMDIGYSIFNCKPLFFSWAQWF